MSVLSRSALEASPLADLHAIASELGIDSYRRLRKAELVDRIVAHQDGDDEDAATDVVDEVADEPEARAKRRRGSRGGRGRAPREAEEETAEEAVVEGVVELLGNGSGFVRVSPPEPSDGDVYVSAAQVRRCELVSGDRVSGPVRRPRRSERYPSLVRVDTINGTPAEEVAEGTPYDELPSEFPSQRLSLDSEDPTLKAIDSLTPIGRGSRVTIVGGARAGKSETLRRIAGALAGVDGLEPSLVLIGVRPEELGEWKSGPVEPAAALSLTAGADAQAQALERAVETAKRIAARGGHALLLVDGLDGIAPGAARKALGAARAIVDGGSLTVIATASNPVGGETTVIALDGARTAARRFPALDLAESGTLRPELLVGDEGAEAIASARAEVV
jgi:transcription termination factor Rho